MNEYIIICIVALLASALTFFSGFGLGTVLMPVFALFFPIDVSIALTAVIHLLNNLFKFSLIGKKFNKEIVLRFGIPSVIAAIFGAWCLGYLSGLNNIATWTMNEKIFQITPIKLVVALLLVVFALFEIIPALSKIEVDKKYLPFGGMLSGFFGGLSGNQGALRSAFLIRAGLTKESFIATGVAIACLIDITRLSVYAKHFSKSNLQENFSLVTAATLSAFAGALIGNRLLKKTTVATIQAIVSVLFFLFAALLASGII